MTVSFAGSCESAEFSSLYAFTFGSSSSSRKILSFSIFKFFSTFSPPTPADLLFFLCKILHRNIEVLRENQKLIELRRIVSILPIRKCCCRNSSICCDSIVCYVSLVSQLCIFFIQNRHLLL
nr:MAG TPA: hypothetical protein [Caudoviricetes sp.]